MIFTREHTEKMLGNSPHFWGFKFYFQGIFYFSAFFFQQIFPTFQHFRIRISSNFDEINTDNIDYVEIVRICHR